MKWLGSDDEVKRSNSVIDREDGKGLWTLVKLFLMWLKQFFFFASKFNFLSFHFPFMRENCSFKTESFSIEKVSISFFSTMRRLKIFFTSFRFVDKLVNAFSSTESFRFLFTTRQCRQQRLTDFLIDIVTTIHHIGRETSRAVILIGSFVEWLP